MAPRQHALHVPLVQFRLDRRQVFGFQTLEKTRFQRNAVDAQFGRPLDEILERPTHSGVRLIRIHFTEIAVVTVAVDADFHVHISSIVRPSTLPRNRMSTR